jgi:hypothetical protein
MDIINLQQDRVDSLHMALVAAVFGGNPRVIANRRKRYLAALAGLTRMRGEA